MDPRRLVPADFARDHFNLCCERKSRRSAQGPVPPAGPGDTEAVGPQPSPAQLPACRKGRDHVLRAAPRRPFSVWRGGRAPRGAERAAAYVTPAQPSEGQSSGGLPPAGGPRSPLCFVTPASRPGASSAPPPPLGHGRKMWCTGQGPPGGQLSLAGQWRGQGRSQGARGHREGPRQGREGTRWSPGQGGTQTRASWLLAPGHRDGRCLGRPGP